jgi:hypothetical protein
MSMYRKLGFPCALALALAACGSNMTSDDAGTTTPGPDAAAPTADTGVTPPPADPYVWVVVQDTEQKACTTNGPGTDIDAVAKVDKNAIPYAWGKNASFTPNRLGNACDGCGSSGTADCKYAAISKTFTEADLVARTEGPADAQVNAVGNDVGYFSLNAGTLQIQLADANTGVLQTINSGDWIAVYEVDMTYYATAVADHFTVSLQNADGKKVLPLKPVTLNPANTACAALAATSTDGCGTTVFAVP